jgi:hypothetical protein
MLRRIVSRYPKTTATVGLIVVMSFVKLAARGIVDAYGLAGTAVALAAIYGVAVLMDRS